MTEQENAGNGKPTPVTKVVTRLGDAGETQVQPGQRGPKDAPRVEACGAIDELGGWLGALRAATQNEPVLGAMLREIQIDLFHVAAALHAGADPSGAFGDSRVRRLEAELDEMNGALPRLANFILAGGTQAASFAHLARAVARRAERRVVTLSRAEAVDAELLRYLNRLSDYLFVLARRLNGNGAGDDLWAPRGVR